MAIEVASQRVEMSDRSEAARPPVPSRDDAIDAVRGAITVLVVAHHAAVTYTTFSRYDAANYTVATAPIVDTARWAPLDSLVASNDIWFMPLMFLVSGLFVVPGFARKGARKFLADRWRRLGIPFALSAVVLVPLAYWPSFLASDDAARGEFLARFFTTDGWPAGPAWFLWVLLALCTVAAFGFPWIARHLGRVAPRSAAELAALVVGVSLVAVVPVRLVVAPYAWTSLGGPFDVQSSRALLYAFFFGLGVLLGRRDTRDALSSQMLRGWPAWLALGLGTFAAHWVVSGGSVLATVPAWFAATVVGAVFAVCCASTSLGVLGAVRAFVRGPSRLGDSLATNAYGIYVLHYPFVTWIGYGLLSSALHPAAKFAIVFASALAGSWASTAALRRTPVRRLL